MMRILLVSDAASIHTRRWAEYFRDEGADVHIASFRTFHIEGVTVHLLPSFGLGKLGYFLSPLVLRRISTQLVPDIVHAHHLTSYGFFTALSGLQPLIVTAWGSDVLISPKKSRLLRFFARYAVHHAAIVTTVAEHMNASVVELGIPPALIEAIPFGVDTQLFAPTGHKICRETLTLICTRNFAPIYDVQTLIKALAKVHARGYRLDIHLTGDGPLRDSLVNLVTALGLKAYVQFHGHVTPESLSKLLANSDIFVTPALSDGNNVSLTEAMACGCFPIATNIPANAQWIQNGRNGYLYPPRDVEKLAEIIQQAADNATVRAIAKTENREIIENRADWRACTKRMKLIYERLSGKCLGTRN